MKQAEDFAPAEFDKGSVKVSAEFFVKDSVKVVAKVATAALLFFCFCTLPVFFYATFSTASNSFGPL